MICEHCGNSMSDGSLTCDRCGYYLGASRERSPEGVRGIRQGRQSARQATLPVGERPERRVYGDYDLSPVPAPTNERPARPRPAPRQQDAPRGDSRPDARRGVPVNAYGRAPNVQRRHGTLGHAMGKRGVNWMLIVVIAVGICVAGGIGYLIYMSQSDDGQRISARRNILAATESMLELAVSTDDATALEREELLKRWNDVPAQAYWSVGREYLDVGDLSTAIVSFRVADAIDPESYDGLLLLANAYELDGSDDLAEKIYLDLVNTVSPFRSEAYTALIRMYQEQARRPEAADMMKLAYEQTDKENFRLLRKDYIPLTPQVDASMPAGRYKLEQDVPLTSPQGYDIYYTTDDDAVLPEQGHLLTEGTVHLTEGIVTLRAVCVSGDLVSDPMSVSYNIYYPTPPAPKCNLAPNTYRSLRTVSFRAGEYETREQKADDGELTFYYTIDGSMPTEDSPVFDGTPVQLPSGKVVLRAIAKNQYGKLSTALEVEYKFSVKPDPLKMYAETDQFSGFKLGDTTVIGFTETFGQPKSETVTTYLDLPGEARRLDYAWGYAEFYLDNNTWKMVRVEMDSAFSTAPRGVGIGSTESEICAVYKDFGQLQAPNGTRGLYYNFPTMGQVLVNDDGTRTVHYACATSLSDVWTLDYHIAKNGRCDRIAHYYQP